MEEDNNELNHNLLTNKANKNKLEDNKSKKKRSNQTDSNNKKKKIKKWNKNLIVDKNKLTMFDLISYNPPVNEEQTKNDDNKKDNNEEEEIINEQKQKKPEIQEIDNEINIDLVDEEVNEDDDSESIGPRVRVNEKGEIVLDEKSLIVKRKKPKEQNIKTVYEDDKTLSTKTNYSSFKKPGKTNEKKLRWTNDETVKFYTALTTIGTDFTLMSDLFFRGRRSRVDLKNKFKQEEKFHKILIDTALKKSDLTSIQNIENLNIDLLSSDSESETNNKSQSINET